HVPDSRHPRKRLQRRHRMGRRLRHDPERNYRHARKGRFRVQILQARQRSDQDDRSCKTGAPMKIDVSTEKLEEYATRIARDQLRGQVKNLITGEMDALQNFSQLRQEQWRLHNEIRRLQERCDKLEKNRWWLRGK